MALPSPATALSRARAAHIALATLAPARQPGDVVVFGLPHAQSARATVFPADLGRADQLNQTPPRKGKRAGILVREHPIGQRAWLFWEDLAYGARFEHPSVLLLISDRDGRILRREAYDWWPLVNGHQPPFMDAGYVASRYVVFPAARKPAATRASRSSSAPVAPAAPQAMGMGPATPVAHTADNLLAPGSLDGECVIEIGLKRDPQFAQDFEGVSAAAVGLRPYGLKGPFAPPPVTSEGHIVSDPNGASLQKEVTDAIIHQNCTDIMIYIGGHGFPAPGSKYPNGKPVKPGDASPHAQVLVGYNYKPAGHDASGNQLYRKTRQTVDSGDLKAILLAHPTTGFKFKIDACFSGRFVDELPREDHPNLVVLETGANNREYSYSYMSEAWVKNGVTVDPDTAGATHFVNTTNNPGNTNAQHLGRGEFTNGNLAGFQTFTSSKPKIDTAIAQGGSLIGHMLVDAFTDGASQDFAQTIGIMHPQIESNVPGAIVGGPAARPTAAFDFSPNAPPSAPKPSQTISFNGSGSSGAGGISSWQWSFAGPLYGGGAPATATDIGVTTTTSYGGPGVYPVTLTVTDAAGATGSTTQQVFVSAAGTKQDTLADIPCSKLAATGGFVDINIPSYAEKPIAALTVALAGCPEKTLKVVKVDFVTGPVEVAGKFPVDEWNRSKNHMHVEFVLEGVDNAGEGSATFTASWE